MNTACVVERMSWGLYDVYAWFVRTGQYGGGCYYAPLFRFLFLPFTLAPGEGGIWLWAIIVMSFASYAGWMLIRDYPRTIALILLPLLVIWALALNIDPLLTCGVLYLMRPKQKLGFAQGVLFGLLTIKPILIIVGLPLLFWSKERFKFLLGAFMIIMSLWGEFLWNLTFMQSYFTNLVAGNMSQDPNASATLWNKEWLFYPWTWAAIYAVIQRKRLQLQVRKQYLKIVYLPHLEAGKEN